MISAVLDLLPTRFARIELSNDLGDFNARKQGKPGVLKTGIVEFRACTSFVPELQEDFQVAYRKGFRWLHASGTTIGSYKMALERTPLSVRFIRGSSGRKQRF